MAPHLNVSAGPSSSSLETLYVNSDLNPVVISTDKFHGRITVRIKHFTGDTPEGKERVKEAKYFEDGLGKGMTWSIQIQGRFLKKVSTEDLVFGNEFDKPIRDSLPYGTSVGLHAAKFIDPTLEHDIYGDKPWAYSPLIATMPRISVHKLPSEPSASTSAAEEFASSGWPAFPTPENGDGSASSSSSSFVQDDVSALIPLDDAEIEMDQSTLNKLKSGGTGTSEEAHKTRAAWFGKKSHRRSVWFTPRDVVTADFCNAFVDFNTLRLELPYTGGMGFDLKKYWDGQPVRYICKDKTDDTVFFVVQFNIVDMEGSEE